MRRFDQEIQGNDSPDKWLGWCLKVSRNIAAALVALFIASLIIGNSPVQANDSAARSRLCESSVCLNSNPLGWQPNAITREIDVRGGVIDDTLNRLTLRFPPRTLLPKTQVHYTAKPVGDETISMTGLPPRGEIVGLFTLEIERRAPQPDATTELPNQAILWQDWTLRLDYVSCSNPAECEFLLYDEASISCYWFNPDLSRWEPTIRTVDINDNQLTCASKTIGTHAIVARRAMTSGDTEAPPVYLPIVMGLQP